MRIILTFLFKKIVKDKFISEKKKSKDLKIEKQDDINELLKIVKCPISDEKLIEDEEGLKYEVNFLK
jgi:hypothetical protein